ncbi:imidazolonepropionase [candidate division WOR-3 bacterium 4484_100]|uniref:Imidazolonepropionase n=1 Tax=candidate division WOR-3 bacterium 4484_100 TaxID=1936077 RepID=A0A1V4QGP0_UNCW3|nr:MAG: imidazolonepropionase [candidate division WOR-3 bacterium 4484_100]
MAILIREANQILTMKRGIGIIRKGSVLIERGIIRRLGRFRISSKGLRVIDARNCVICPGFVDSHTHLVFAGYREKEFALRIKGMDYETIARKGGGIAYTVKHTQRATVNQLFELARKRIERMIKQGTTTVEIKSGYGISKGAELKMLKVISRLKRESSLDIVATLLIHIPAKGVSRRKYLNLILEEIIPEVGKKRLAQFCDVFCDRIAFTRDESEKILSRAREFGLKLKIHADELTYTGGARLAARLGCVSADHLLYTRRADIYAMKKAKVVPTLLPGTSFFLQLDRKPDVRTFRQENIGVAIASDYNPGSCMLYAMPKIVALACLVYQMSVEEALLGATKYGARALAMEHKVGSLEVGRQADLVVLEVNNYQMIPYTFGEDIVKFTIKNGRIIYGKDN